MRCRPAFQRWPWIPWGLVETCLALKARNFLDACFFGRCACFVATPSSIVSWSDDTWTSDFAVVADELCLLYHIDSHCNAIAIYFKQHEKPNLGGLLLFILTPPPATLPKHTFLSHHSDDPMSSLGWFVGALALTAHCHHGLHGKACVGISLVGLEMRFEGKLPWSIVEPDLRSKLPPRCLMLIATGNMYEMGQLKLKWKVMKLRSMGAVWEPVIWVTGLISLLTGSSVVVIVYIIHCTTLIGMYTMQVQNINPTFLVIKLIWHCDKAGKVFARSWVKVFFCIQHASHLTHFPSRSKPAASCRFRRWPCLKNWKFMHGWSWYRLRVASTVYTWSAQRFLY